MVLQFRNPLKRRIQVPCSHFIPSLKFGSPNSTPKVKVISSRCFALSLWRDLKHDHVGMHAPSKTLSRLAQSPLKGFGSTLPGKDPLPVVPAIDHTCPATASEGG